jgi:hypothetical protein
MPQEVTVFNLFGTSDSMVPYSNSKYRQSVCQESFAPRLCFLFSRLLDDPCDGPRVHPSPAAMKLVYLPT